jgi:hypothetical protein
VRRGIEGAVLNDGEQFGFKSSDNFYFTNFPEQISHFYLKKAFEVCGILEKVYVAKKRNVHGQKYGFVRFSKVKDVSKLLLAINDIHFGQFRIWARVARFDKPRVGVEGKGHKRGGREDGRHGGGHEREKVVVGTGKGENIAAEEKQGATVLEVAAVGKIAGASKGGELRVGEVVVLVGVVKGQKGESETTRPMSLKQSGVGMKANGECGSSESGELNRKLVRRYRSNPFDLKWARQGVVVTVKNGEVISVIQ